MCMNDILYADIKQFFDNTTKSNEQNANLYQTNNMDYSNAVSNKEFYISKNAYSFYSANKSLVWDMIQKHPKVTIDDVTMLAGMTKEDMPYIKEAISSKLLHDILGKDIILLPRYLNKLFNRQFGLNLADQTTVGDSIYFVDGSGIMAEYKLINGKHAVSEINSSLQKSDLAFIVTKGTSKEKRFIANNFKTLKIKGIEGKSAIILNLDNGKVYQVNKKGAVVQPLELSIVGDTGEITSAPDEGLIEYDPTHLNKNYIEELKKVNPGEPIEFENYQNGRLSLTKEH